jgi:protein gp37
MTTTTIEWTNYSWNPVRGCSRLSDGCRNCYAERQALRFAGAGGAYEDLVEKTSQGAKWTGKVNWLFSKLDEPLRLKDPRRIFVNSMGDLFHPGVPDYFIADVWAYMAVGYWHQYQVLTKHADRMAMLLSSKEFLDLFEQALALALDEAGSIVGRRKGMEDLRAWAGDVLPLPNVEIGVSAENQKAANDRIPCLLQTPAVVRWVSTEPLLGCVDLRSIDVDGEGLRVDALQGLYFTRYTEADATPNGNKLDWVVAGGESGPGARPVHPDWIRSLRDQCVAAGVPFFFKQWGEWAPATDTMCLPANKWREFPDGETNCRNVRFLGDEAQQRVQLMGRVGKKVAGRQLDGRTWDEYPIKKEKTV